jgi:DinB superfamily
MTKQIEIIRKTRAFLLESLKDLSVEQFNQIPEGFNNNIVWNLGHMIAAQQGICYIRAGITPVVNQDFIDAYKSGSKPGEPVDAAAIENIKTLLSTTLDQLETDYNNHLFDNYISWTTRYNVEVVSIDDAISFLPFHDGLHSGGIGVLRKLVIR